MNLQKLGLVLQYLPLCLHLLLSHLLLHAEALEIRWWAEKSGLCRNKSRNNVDRMWSFFSLQADFHKNSLKPRSAWVEGKQPEDWWWIWNKWPKTCKDTSRPLQKCFKYEPCTYFYCARTWVYFSSLRLVSTNVRSNCPLTDSLNCLTLCNPRRFLIVWLIASCTCLWDETRSTRV